jgi:hypothetical protein
MPRRALLALVVALAVPLSVAGPAGRANSAGKERRYSNTKYGVTIDAPAGWTLSPHTGYPDILIVLLHPSGARISLAAAPTTLAGAQELADQNRRGLEAQGLTVSVVSPAPRGGVIVDAQSKTGADRVRQYYLVRTAEDQSRQALVLTLTSPAAVLPTTEPTFTTLVSRLLTDSPQPR